jgi:putative resolvase
VPARQLPTGTILVEVPTPPVGVDGCKVVSGRVSSHHQRADLDCQVSRVLAWTTAQRLAVQEVVCEVGSGLNGRRPKLQRLLGDPQVTVLVVHRDRLARFGVQQLQAALAAQGRRIVVADDGETTEDRVGDMVEVLSGLCARLDGRPGAQNGALRAVTATRDPKDSAA